MAWKSLCSQVSQVNQKDYAIELYQKLQEEEDRLGQELDQLLEQQTQIDMQMTNFKQIIPALQDLHSDSNGLNEAISKTSRLAETISGKVRVLDTAKTNVYAALKRVEDIIDLKNCVDGVEQSMTSGNYEQVYHSQADLSAHTDGIHYFVFSSQSVAALDMKAAVHVRRYLDLDEAVLSESVNSLGTNTVSNSFSKLKEAEQKLKKIVKDKLSYAVFHKDKEDVERFVKLMPLLNLHEEGVQELTKFLSSEIREYSNEKLRLADTTTGNQSGLVYAEILMQVYEYMAHKHEEYLTMIESVYGLDWIVPFVKEVQNECDHCVVDILKQHSEERSLDNKIHTIAIALNSRSTAGAIRPEPRELDTLLMEMGLISSRSELYFKYLKKKEKALHITDSGISNTIKASRSSRQVQELVGNYILIENFFMRESLSKAISVDECGLHDKVSSLSDDAFFVLQKSLKRAFTTHNTDAACAMINNASTLLLKEYKEQLQSNLIAQSAINQSGTGLSDFPSMFQTQLSKTSTPGQNPWNGIGVACNNIETSCQNLNKLITLLQSEIKLLLTDYGETEKEKLQSCLSELSTTLTAFQEVKQEAQTHLVEDLISPELTPIIKLFSSVSHDIDEDVLMDDEFVQRIAVLLSQKLTEAKDHLLPELYEDLVVQVVTDLSKSLEVEILSSAFNQLGGVRLDRDLRQLISYLSSQTQRPVRDKFSRILQMATILSLEKVSELMEYYDNGLAGGSALLHLNIREVKAVLHLRKDFNDDEIDDFTI